jgi:hypothetical protein
MVFSNSSGNTGIVERVRSIVKLDSIQLPTWKIVNSCNDYLDVVAGYFIATDKRFQWDDTNHSKLPIGTTNLVANQSDYSFLTDEQSNKILTLTRIDLLRTTGGVYEQLSLIDQGQINSALDEFEKTAGIPYYYDKIADNIVRLYPKPAESITSGLKFYFQRTPSYFVATDTTKEPGVSPLLHRGFVIASAYDAAFSEGLPNIQALSIELQKERQKMVEFFAGRNNDDLPTIMTVEETDYL